MNPTDDNDVCFFLFCVLIYFVASRLPSYFDATAIQAKIRLIHADYWDPMW